jgi:hypothetical protein
VMMLIHMNRRCQSHTARHRYCSRTALREYRHCATVTLPCTTSAIVPSHYFVNEIVTLRGDVFCIFMLLHKSCHYRTIL